MRYFFYIDQAPAIGLNDRWMGLVLRYSSGGIVGVVQEENGTTLRLTNSANLPTPSGRATHVNVPTGHWVCLEMAMVFGNSSTGKLQLSLDGVAQQLYDAADSPVGTSFVTNTMPPSAYTDLEIGPYVNQFSNNMSPPAVTMWIDELIVDHNPIGCAK